ncbi:hypothetical protein JMJ77_0011785 [Colletotrichum scovillei]|uniref:Uncharacterized protein n=1 Tax=Colletotrichum scovillei TaxID=1209932 RepID=A0A9P7QXG5_9PEZI|nr:hypothetical protein JMJ77_0011785 [Colletotrichum scovillei]KAG7046066.1 hypothetical protein JMJ78_0011135 [Colletotrichum scovillei]KAG7063414.1 hypothetical protein JMJ76_0005880 [Colletotrichum scovillei]
MQWAEIRAGFCMPTADASEVADQDKDQPCAAPRYRTGKMEVHMQCIRIPSVGELGTNHSIRLAQTRALTEFR